MTNLSVPLIDAHQLGLGETGNETWARCIVQALEADGGTPLRYVVTDAAADSLPSSIGQDRTELVAGSSTRRLLVDLPRIVRRTRPSALLVQYTLPPIRVPGVVAVRDLSFERPEAKNWIPPLSLARYRATIRMSVRKAEQVVVSTEWTRRDLLDRYPVDPDRVTVAPNSLDPNLARMIDGKTRKTDLGVLTVLCVGTVLPRKNLIAAARAVAELRRQGLPVRLRVVGPARDATVVAAIREALPGDALVLSGMISPDELAQAYADADALCFPSRFEGFGIPLIEAMHAGVPVVASDATCLPEVAGGAALHVSPDDQPGWEQALGLALNDDETRNRLVSAGHQRAKDYSWEAAAVVVRKALTQAAASAEY